MKYLIVITFLTGILFHSHSIRKVEAGFPLMYESQEEKIQIETSKSKEEIAMDNLLGPDIDFPFRPENHRDNSNPIGRIDPLIQGAK